MRGRLGNTRIIIRKRERPKRKRYALAIDGDEDVCDVVEGDEK